MTLLIVGASVAGVRTAQALRMKGYDGPITLLGEESYAPYDKPPLSKEMILPDGDPAPVPLLTDEQLADLRVDLRLGVRASELDVSARTVTTDAGEAIAFDRLVIATGVTPRTLPGADRLAGVHTLRNAEDAAALRTGLATAGRVVVIGAGFIGAEFAAAACRHGVQVTLVEAQNVPLSHLLGAEVGARLAEVHAAAGNELVTGVGVAHLEGEDAVRAVVLNDGRRLPADLVVVGIGATPATGWLDSSGLPISDGVECGADLTVVGAEGIYAAGDVARWPHPHYGYDLRIEHWTNANDHAAIIAAAVTGAAAPTPTVPYVWSDQYGHRIQIVGRPATGSLAHVAGTLSGGDLVAAYVGTVGELVGAVVVDDPRLLMKCRKAITAGSVWADLDLVPAGV
ncbi:FAD-dependent oxidoreductase [Nocardioides sp. LHD-245]|uniref:NAD(P)/FAD-dependent oxidoreductase n=1 Tax=Nocardioides sp. LHD-245 TaxID=3051387 RepID=UPI0027DFA59D|nr:FAD-dependent oxidoreductase [Nocardioides sp. LHD-245]